MSLDEQVYTIEHALSERMIKLVFTVLRQWTIELGNSDYLDRMHALEDNYSQTFKYYLTNEDADRDQVLDKLTLDAYRLVDEVYVDLRLKRGLSPHVHGFNENNIQSVMQYFSSCIKFSESDFEWLGSVLSDPKRQGIAMMALAALSPNLRECFNERMMYLLIDAINNGSNVAADQALASVILLMVHYDSRLYYYPDLQEAFVNAIGDGERAFHVMNALIQSIGHDLHKLVLDTNVNPDDVPQVLHDIIEKDFGDIDVDDVITFMPVGEKDYLSDIIELLPATWVYSTIVEDDEHRESVMDMAYMEAGSMERMLEDIDAAEQFLINRLRGDHARPVDYINYGHCCFIRGDRLMAFENYRQARSMCKSLQEFCDIFRPTRRVLLEKDVPLEQIYLMEDNLMTLDK